MERCFTARELVITTSRVQWNVAFVSPSNVQTLAENTFLRVIFFTCDPELSPLTLTIELDLDSVKMNHRAKYLGQRSFRAKVIIATPDRVI